MLAACLGAPLASGASPATAPVDEFTETPGSTPTPRGASTAGAATSGRGLARPTPGGKKKLLIGFGDLDFVNPLATQRRAVLDEARAANGKVARLYADWRHIAPQSPSPAFDASNPASPEYDWSALDASVRDAAARKMRVLLLVNEAPAWAEGANRPSSVLAGTWKPSPSDLADFGRALARRYSGSFAGLPRVRDFVVWNEPNLETNLTPVWKGKSGKKPAAPSHYRKMLNAFYNAVHKVNRKSKVVGGGTAPYGADPGVLNMRPLLFWRKLLCIKGNGKPQKKCREAKFDVLAHHPINTSGGPRRSAISDDDISTPDLHNLVDVLRKSERAGNVKPKKGKHQVWATELWWESNPPDPAGVSLNRQANYYTEALYILWKQGASMVLPYQVRDDAYDGKPGRTSFETGAYFVDGEAKPAKRAIEFPFVADRKSKKKVLLWGVAPKTGRLKVKEKGKKGKVARIRVKSGKVFKEKVRLRGKAKLQARVKGERSRNWKVKRK